MDPPLLQSILTQEKHSPSNSQPPCYDEDTKTWGLFLLTSYFCFSYFLLTLSSWNLWGFCLFLCLFFFQLYFFLHFSIFPTLFFRFIFPLTTTPFCLLPVRLKCLYDSVVLRSEHFAICSFIFGTVKEGSAVSKPRTVLLKQWQILLNIFFYVLKLYKVWCNLICKENIFQYIRVFITSNFNA